MLKSRANSHKWWPSERRHTGFFMSLTLLEAVHHMNRLSPSDDDSVQKCAQRPQASKSISEFSDHPQEGLLPSKLETSEELTDLQTHSVRISPAGDWEPVLWSVPKVVLLWTFGKDPHLSPQPLLSMDEGQAGERNQPGPHPLQPWPYEESNS